jgi:hypothetical protein
MSIARPFHVVAVFAAFLFVGAIVIGALEGRRPGPDGKA